MVLPILLVSTIFMFGRCTSPDRGSTVFLNHADSVAYVGMAVCASCHPEQFNTFRHTGMGRSFGPASRARSTADFHHAEVYDSSTGLRYRAYWRHDSLFMAEYLLGSEVQSGKQDTVHYLERSIDHIVGSGQHTHSHLFSVGEYIYQAPMTYYTQEGKWDLPPGFEGGNNSRFRRIIDVECMSCHNAMPRMASGSDLRFASIGSGIDCERCHGPGELHASMRSADAGPPPGMPDSTIVHPGRLPVELQLDLCQRCHLQGLNVLKPGKRFTDFKPGMKLSDVFEVYLPNYAGGEGKLDMANHAARFQLSACVTSKPAEVAFNCISCHNPHVSVTQTSHERYNANCASCHVDGDAWQRKHEPENTDCVHCHMPRVSSEDILHVAIHDHRIQVPGATEAQGRGKLIGLYAVNEPEPEQDRLLLAYLEYWEKFDKNPFYLDMARELLKDSRKPELQLKYHYLTQAYDQVLYWADQLSEPDAWTSYMIGESAIRLKQEGLAEFYWQRSQRLDPDRVEVGLKLAHLQIRRRKWNMAEQTIAALAQRFPMDGLVANAAGELAMKRGDLPGAAAHMERALQLEPVAREVWENCYNLAMAYGHEQDMIRWADRILQRWPDHPDRILLMGGTP